ncbi:MAG: DNA/RNA non-specific endonuclease [Prevotella sp.]|jgi:endonuclease G|nr:DNA/RNA non-specific endonuclease [Prevotella sp.]
MSDIRKNIKYIIYLICFGIFTFTSCSDDGEDTPSIAILMDKSTVEASAGEQFIEIKATGNWTLSIDFPQGTGQWCMINNSKEQGTGNAYIVLKTYANLDTEDRTATIILESGSERISQDIIQKGKSTTDPGTDPEPTRGKWLELPEIISQNGQKAITHYTGMIVGNANQTVRNYSMLYDTKEKIAYWVAYPLHSSYLGSADRTDKWAFDPALAQSEQGNFIKGFPSLGYSGFDRGHQIPSADRTNTRAANEQTFYYTNMTAQNSTLNQGVWANLETQCRSWIPKYDTLYVVTGALLKTVGNNETVTYMKDHSDNQIAKPNYYYKVLLGKSGNTYKSIGFWFENKSYQSNKNFINYAMSVRDIEKRSGFNFFSNLPQSTQDEVESAFKAQDWGL